jgi:peptide/nickel transport system substrate-binding protein
MSQPFRVAGALAAIVFLVTACAPAPTTGGEPRPAEPRPQRTLVIVTGAELPSFASKPLEALPNPRADFAALFLNANLVYLNERALPMPYLVDVLPELNTDTWRVFPDGRMETTYRLKPNLIWHDSQPLTAEDFVFAWRVYSVPEFGVSDRGGFRSIEQVTAADPRTIVIGWKDRYVLAGQVGSSESNQQGSALPPLPRHILEQAFAERQPGNSFAGLPFWSNEYVGVGPWKLDHREPGAYFEATAFDGFVFGRPKIDRIRVIYQADTNVIVATMLAGEAHLSGRTLLHGEEGVALEQGWSSTKGGVVLWGTDIPKGQEIQQRAEFAVPTQMASDARVRQALISAIDRETLTEIVTAGRGLYREIFSHANSPNYDEVLRAVPTRYPYDVRRGENLLREAGFARGADDGWLTPSGQRFTLEQWYLAGATNERDSQIIVDMLRRFGIDASSNVFSIQRSSLEDRVKTSGIFGGSFTLPDQFHSRNIARAENRWAGINRFGHSNPDLDRYVDAYLVSLDRSERIRNLIQMERTAMEQVSAIPTYWTAVVTGHAATLKGVAPILVPEAGEERMMWTWEWTSAPI